VRAITRRRTDGRSKTLGNRLLNGLELGRPDDFLVHRLPNVNDEQFLSAFHLDLPQKAQNRFL
jgi:hypothetical protein